MFLRATASGLLSIVADVAERTSDRIRPPFDYEPRLIPPPKVGRWHVVVDSGLPAAEEMLVGRYRTKLVARLIAGRLPGTTGSSYAYRVQRASDSGSNSSEGETTR